MKRPMNHLFQPGRRRDFFTMWAALSGAWAAFSAAAVVLSCARAEAINPLPALGFIAATAIGLLVFPPLLLLAGHAVCRGVRHVVNSFSTIHVGRSRHAPS